MKSRKALCYLNDVIILQTGTIISRNDQKQRIIAHAEKNGIEIIDFYEDRKYDEEVLSRPGVQAMLLDEREYDLILVDSVWVFSRNWSILKNLLKIISLKSVKLESASILWDCTSQRSRNYPGGRELKHRRKASPQQVPVAEKGRKPVKIKMPATLNFVNLKSH